MVKEAVTGDKMGDDFLGEVLCNCQCIIASRDPSSAAAGRTNKPYLNVGWLVSRQGNQPHISTYT